MVRFLAYRILENSQACPVVFVHRNKGVPGIGFQNVEYAAEGLRLAHAVVGKSNQTAASDLGVAALNLRSALLGAWLNVRINLGGIDDQAFADEYRAKGEALIAEVLPLADEVYRLTEEILAGETRPEALIVGSDSIAKGVLQALEDHGICIPQDIRLVIYQDIRTTQLPSVSVAMIHAYPDLLWQKAIQMIIELTRGRTEQVTTVISPQLLFME